MVCIVALPVGAAFVEQGFAAPITFNTALPVSQGDVILRLQAIATHSSREATDFDRDLDEVALPLVGAYGATPRLALFAFVPTVGRQLDVTTASGRQTRRVAGVGDVSLLARFTVYQSDRPGRTLRLAPFVGVETPTGEDDERDSLGLLPRALQPGSGSWDPIIGAILTRQTLEWEIDVSASYKANAASGDFNGGNVSRFDFSYQRRLSPRKLGSGVPRFVYGVLESNLIWQERHRVGGIADPSSGGLTWSLAPGLQYVTKRLILEAAVQIPIVQELRGNALKTEWTTLLSARVHF